MRRENPTYLLHGSIIAEDLKEPLMSDVNRDLTLDDHQEHQAPLAAQRGRRPAQPDDVPGTAEPMGGALSHLS